MLASEFILVVEQLEMRWEKDEWDGFEGILVSCQHLAEFYPLLGNVPGAPTIAYMDYKSAYHRLSSQKHDAYLRHKNYCTDTTKLYPDYQSLPPNDKKIVEANASHNLPERKNENVRK